jgi:hypothetical protein
LAIFYRLGTRLATVSYVDDEVILFEEDFLRIAMTPAPVCNTKFGYSALLLLGALLAAGCIPKNGPALGPVGSAEARTVIFKPYQFNPAQRDHIDLSIVEARSIPEDCDETRRIIAQRPPVRDFKLTVTVSGRCDYDFDIYLGKEDERQKEVLSTASDVYKNDNRLILSDHEANENGDILFEVPFTVIQKATAQPSPSPAVPPSFQGGSTSGGLTGDRTQVNPPAQPARPAGNPPEAPLESARQPEPQVAEKFKALTISQGDDEYTMDQKLVGNYVLIDLSASYCGACQSLAAVLNNTKYQTMVQNSKCSLFTFVDKSDLDDWRAILKSKGLSHAAAHSYFLANSTVKTVKSKLGSSSRDSSLPYMLLMNIKTGEIVRESIGFGGSSDRILVEFSKLCQ